MKLLLDTQVLLWAAGNSKRLSASARTLLNDPANDLCFSAASLWKSRSRLRSAGRTSVWSRACYAAGCWITGTWNGR